MTEFQKRWRSLRSRSPTTSVRSKFNRMTQEIRKSIGTRKIRTIIKYRFHKSSLAARSSKIPSLTWPVLLSRMLIIHLCWRLSTKACSTAALHLGHQLIMVNHQCQKLQAMSTQYMRLSMLVKKTYLVIRMKKFSNCAENLKLLDRLYSKELRIIRLSTVINTRALITLTITTRWRRSTSTSNRWLTSLRLACRRIKTRKIIKLTICLEKLKRWRPKRKGSLKKLRWQTRSMSNWRVILSSTKPSSRMLRIYTQNWR